MNAQPKRISSAAMMIENANGELLIVKANYKPYWTLPGGIVNIDETPKQAAIRETREEIGITIDANTVTFVAVIDRISDVTQTYQFLFKAKLPTGADKTIVLQTSEIDDWAFIKKTDVAFDDHLHAKAIQHWAAGETGYIEQSLEER